MVWAAHKCIISRDVTFHKEALLKNKDTTVFDSNLYTDESIKGITTVKDSRVEMESTSSSDSEMQNGDATKDFQERSEGDESRTLVTKLQDC